MAAWQWSSWNARVTTDFLVICRGGVLELQFCTHDRFTKACVSVFVVSSDQMRFQVQLVYNLEWSRSVLPTQFEIQFHVLHSQVNIQDSGFKADIQGSGFGT